jgi:hypothetical protein
VFAHWGWVCQVLEPTRLANLEHYTAAQLAVVNARAEPAEFPPRGPATRADWRAPADEVNTG